MFRKAMVVGVIAAGSLLAKSNDKVKQFAQPEDKVWRAVVRAASSNGNSVKAVEKDSRLIVFQTKGGFVSDGYNVTVHVEPVGESSSEVSLSFRYAGDQTKQIKIGDGSGKNAKKFFESVEEELGK